MIAFAQAIGTIILGMALFLLAWDWVPLTLMALPIWLMDYRGFSRRRAMQISWSVSLVGGFAFWYGWTYLAPAWVRTATPILVRD